jgi:MoaA/NifB/PqqE/SkfB family radical SAM enzyme
MSLSQFDALSKIRFHHDWVTAYKRGEVVAPISVEMDLTNRCNYGCPNCVWGEYIGGNRAHVPHEQALQQVRDCAAAGVKAIIFSGGGEPLLNRATPDAIRLAKELGMSVGLFTHGQLITPEIAEVLVDHCDWARIHLDGATPETYTRRHRLQASNLERVRGNLTGLHELAGARGSAIEVGIGAVINPDNVADLPGLAAFAYETGCKYLQTKHDFELLPFKHYTEWWEREVVPQLVALKAHYAPLNFGIQFTTADYTRAPTALTCHIHHLTTAINAEGEVVYCKRLRDKTEWATGNVGEEPLADILHGERNRQLSQDVTPQNCGINCPYIELNEHIDRLVNAADDDDDAAARGGEVRHPNFF